MVKTHWHLRITLESSAKARAEELAQADRRSSANYVQILIEKDLREKEPAR
jgi:predicted DNA-binding protein